MALEWGLGRLAAAFMDSLATTGYPEFWQWTSLSYGLPENQMAIRSDSR